MSIEKNGKKYEVSERSYKWVLKDSNGKVTIKFEVSKQDCPTVEDLERFIKTETAL